MANQADYSDDSNQSSDEDYANFYSGAAKRFKTQKQAVFKTGIVKLVKNKDDSPVSSERKIGSNTHNIADVDSSDEEVFREVDLKKDNSQQDELDQSRVTNFNTQVLEDVEECDNLSPDVSLNHFEERRIHSSASLVVEEEFILDEDPLCCDPLNDSVSVRLFN